MRIPRLVVVAVPVILLVTAVAVAFWSAQRALTGSASIAAHQHQIPFTLRPIDPAATLASNPGFEPVSAPDDFITGTQLDRTFYLAGPNGLTVIAPDGTRRATLRTGFELPVAPITAVATARLRGSTDSQILLATRGAGLLMLDVNSKGSPIIHQLLPDTNAARDLTAILATPSGDLLLGTRHAGVLLFDGSAIVPYPNLPVAEITALAATDSASFLVGTRTSGLSFVHAGTIQHADAMPDTQVESLVAVNGKAYAGTPTGIAEFDLSQPMLKPTRIVAPGLFAHALSLTGETLEVGTLDQGIQRVALANRPRMRNAALELDAATQSNGRVDGFISGSRYALVDGTLLARTTAGWRPALTPTSATLADRNISALAFAPDGSLYVGFFDHGLDILGSTGQLRHIEDDHLFCINRLALDPARQTIAAATANGLVLFDRQGTPRQTLTRRDGLISDHVTDIAFTATGTTLATPAGLTFLTATGTESLYAFQGLVNNHVYTIAAANNRLLAGTLGGISLLEANAVKRNFTATNSGLKHNWITAITPSPHGGYLVGTYGAGIETLSADGNSFTPIELPAGTPHDLIINPNAMLVTATHVYAGTLGHGMLVLNTATNRWSHIDKGLPSLNVTAFAQRDGVLYIGTENGLVRIPEARLP